MVCARSNEIINISTFEKEISPLFCRNNRKVIIDTPAIRSNIEIVTPDFTKILEVVTATASKLPHRRCAVIYKFNDNVLTIEIHPVTDAA